MRSRNSNCHKRAAAKALRPGVLEKKDDGTAGQPAAAGTPVPGQAADAAQTTQHTSQPQANAQQVSTPQAAPQQARATAATGAAPASGDPAAVPEHPVFNRVSHVV